MFYSNVCTVLCCCDWTGWNHWMKVPESEGQNKRPMFQEEDFGSEPQKIIKGHEWGVVI